jgi:septal ring factor EnvC (AmiA/AmiB activator)
MSRPFLLVFSLCFCIFVSKAPSDTLGINGGEQENQLSRIINQLDEKRDSIQMLNQTERNTFEQLLDLEERLESAERLKRGLTSEQRDMDQELQTKQKGLEEIDVWLHLHSVTSRRRLKQIYEGTSYDPYAALAQAPSPTELALRVNFSRRIVKQDLSRLQDTRSSREELETKQQYLTGAQSRLAWLKGRKAEEERVYQEELNRKEAALKQIRLERKLYAQAMAQLEQDAIKLESILAEVNQQNPNGFRSGTDENGGTTTQPADGLFAISKGKLPWPVRGKVVSFFGEHPDAQSQAEVRNPGIDIAAEPGTEVVAVADGRVVYSSRLRGYGDFVIIEHDGGYYTLYARLSQVSVTLNQEIDRLQVIGVLGENEPFFGSSLHFEIRDGKTAQDPLKWLRP